MLLIWNSLVVSINKIIILLKKLLVRYRGSWPVTGNKVQLFNAAIVFDVWDKY